MRVILFSFTLIFFFSCQSQHSYHDKNGKSPSDVFNEFLASPFLVEPVYSGDDVQSAFDKGFYSKAQEALLFKKEYVSKFGYESYKDYTYSFAIPEISEVKENTRVDFKVHYQGSDAAIYYIPARRYVHFKLINEEWIINDRLAAGDNLPFGKIFWAEQRVLLQAAYTPDDLNEDATRKNDLKAKPKIESNKDGLIKAIWPIYFIKVAMKEKSVISQSPSENALKLLTLIAHGETEKSKNFSPLVKLLIKQCKNDLKLCASDQKTALWFALAQYAEMVGSTEWKNYFKSQLEDILSVSQNNNFDDGSLLLNYSFQTALFMNLKNLLKDSRIDGLLKEREKQISKIKLGESKNQFSSFYRANYLFNCSLLNISYSDILLTSAIDDVKKEDYLMTWLLTVACWYKGGEVWKEYNNFMAKTLGNAQQPDGLWNDNLSLLSRQSLNSYNSIKEQVSTSLAALSLTIYYRYIPLYKSGKGARRQQTKKSDVVSEEFLDLVD